MQLLHSDIIRFRGMGGDWRAMAWFQWVSPRPLPAAWDLRGCGWRLIEIEGEAGGPVARLIDGSVADVAPERLAPALRPRALVLGLADSAARARWLAMGYADALSGDVALAELGHSVPPGSSTLPARRAAASVGYGLTC